MHCWGRAQGAPCESQREIHKIKILRDGADAPTPGPCHISQPTPWETLSPSHKPLGAFAALWSR